MVGHMIDLQYGRVMELSGVVKNLSLSRFKIFMVGYQ